MRKNQFAWTLKHLLLILVPLGIFLFLLYPLKPKNINADDIKASKTLGAKNILDLVHENKIIYAWTKPNARFIVTNLNRYTPLHITLYLNLGKLSPQQEKSTQISIEILPDAIGNTQNNSVRRVIATFQGDGAQSGFQPYSFTVPPEFTNKNQLEFWIVTNPPSLLNNQVVGVPLGGFKIEVTDPYSHLTWPQPYLPAILILIVAIVLWTNFANFDWLETLLLTLPFVLITAALETFLLRFSWLLLVAALTLVGLNLLCRIYLKRLALKLILEQEKEIGETVRIRKLKSIYPLILLVIVFLGGLAVSTFVIGSPAFIFDTRLFFRWINQIHQYGPFDIYRHAPSLDYPPFIVYLFWLYGWILAPFGLINSVIIFKVWLAIGSFSSTIVIWLLLRTKFPNIGVQFYQVVLSNFKRVQVLALFSIALFFNPAVWGQVDSLLTLMVLVTFWLVFSAKPQLAGVFIGLLLIFKPQVWLLLPLLAVLIIKKAGWKQGLIASLLGLSVSSILSVLAFGSPDAFLKFFLQSSLAGTAGGDAPYGTLYAFNLLWLLGFDRQPPTDLIMWIGFGLIGLIELIVLIRAIWGRAKQEEISLAAAIVMVVFFLVTIKMRERYLYYPLPLLIWASMYNRKIIKPYLILNICCLLNTLAGYLYNQERRVPKDFYYWPSLIQPTIISWLTLLTTLYLLWLYLKPLLKINLTEFIPIKFSQKRLAQSLGDNLTYNFKFLFKRLQK